jgi:hypothetical protein
MSTWLLVSSDSFYSKILHCVKDDSPAGVILSGSEESRFMRPITGKVQNESLPFAGLDRCLPIAVSEIVIVLHCLNLFDFIMPPGGYSGFLFFQETYFERNNKKCKAKVLEFSPNQPA